MATYRITGPDGATYQVTAPDNASQDAILAYVRNQAAAPGAPSSSVASPAQPGASGSGPAYQEPPNPIESLGHGFANVAAKMQQLYGMATGNDEKLKAVTDQTNADNALYDQGRAKGQAQAKAQFGDIGTARALIAQALPMGADLQAQRFVAAGGGPDTMSTIGETLPTAPLAALGAPATVVGRLAMGAGLGGAQGLSQFDPEGTAASTAIQAGKGALAGGVAQGVGETAVAVGAPLLTKLTQAFRAVSNRVTGATEPAAVQTALASGLKDAGLDWNALDGTRQAQITASATQALKAGRPLDPAVLLRKADFDALDVPYTAAQVTRDARQWTAEQRVRKIEGVGDPLQQTLEAQNEALAGQLPAMRAASGAKAGSGYEAAENAREAVQGFSKESQQQVGAMYQAARDAAGASSDVPLAPIADRLGKVIEDYGVENVPPAVVSRAKEYGLLDGTQKRTFTVTDAEQFRKFIGNNVNPANAAQASALRQLQGSIDDAVGSLSGVGADAGQAFQQARSAAANRFGQLEPTPVAALNKTDEAPVNFVETKILGGKPGELASLRSVINQKNPQAWDDIRGSVLDWLQQKAQARGTFNGGAFKDALDRIGQARLKVLFSADELSRLGTISRAGFNATVAPPLSAVNHSNTASELANLLSNKDTGPGLASRIAGHFIPGVGPAFVGAVQTGKQALAQQALRSAAKASASPGVAQLSPLPSVDQRALAQLLLRFAPQGAARADQGSLAP